MDLKNFIDNFGYITDINSIISLDEYKQLSLDDKKIVLQEILDINYKNSKEKKKKRDIKTNNIELQQPKDIIRSNTFKSECKNKHVNVEQFLLCNSIEEMIEANLVPKRDEENFHNKIKKIIVNINMELEEYKMLKKEDKDDIFKDTREKFEHIMDILIDYNTYEDEVVVPKKNNFQIFYLPSSLESDNGTLSPIIKDIAKNNEKNRLIEMIDSIKNQEFKGLKRFGNYLSEFYELRHNQQRVVFHFLTDNVAIIISAFTKKDNNSKKYREDLVNRISKYRNIKSKLKKYLKDEQFIEKQLEIDEIIYNYYNKEKKLEKIGDNFE